MNNKRWLMVGVAVIVALFALLVWPSLYRYDTLRVPSEDRVLALRGVYVERLVRTNRITGYTEELTKR